MMQVASAIVAILSVCRIGLNPANSFLGVITSKGIVLSRGAIPVVSFSTQGVITDAMINAGSIPPGHKTWKPLTLGIGQGSWIQLIQNSVNAGDTFTMDMTVNDKSGAAVYTVHITGVKVNSMSASTANGQTQTNLTFNFGAITWTWTKTGNKFTDTM